MTTPLFLLRCVQLGISIRVTLLVILGVLVGIIVILMRQKGIQITVANIKEFCRNGIRDIKDRSKDEASGDDIFGGTKKNEKKDKDDIF